MLYTVKNPAGDIIASDVTAAEAAHAIMADDARGAEIRDFYRVDGVISDGLEAAEERAAAVRADIMAETPMDDDDAADMLARAADVKPVFEAWYMCRQTVHDRWSRRTSYSSTAVDYDTAELDIALEIIAAAPGWSRPYQIEPD
jgi:hypothetical protein